VRDDLQAAIRRLASLHAPLGRWTPIAASTLFAGAGLSHSNFLRMLAYCGACFLVILIGADIAKSLIDRHSYPYHGPMILTLPMLTLRVLLSALLGGFYSFLVFVGLGPFTPFILWPVILAVCCFIAWRNIDLWYEQGVEFEEELAEEAHRSRAYLAGAVKPETR
jgi:hypothetical protein